ncbi:hydroxylysine kinase-like [Argiope bruennichi]|uniref:Hydroxylysine kinase n=1 Tax=Argiope bruennichi TaxID=94029 RepID=A0A8T0ECM2_ARGBR|nr:hydroxylysine kinase-like [Argiope bruennichi]KAF8770581.1 Hydroxylysine kinase like protein [Argiope bruennichi]
MDIDNILKPNISAEAAVEMVRNMYGLEVTSIKPMGSFNDQNFYIQISNQHQNPYIDEVSEDGYTLKIINATKSSIAGHFDSMHVALHHLQRKGLRVPVPVKNLEGSTWKVENVRVLSKDKESNANEKCGVHLLTYLTGTPIAAIQITPDILFNWGYLLAQFHNATEDLVCPDLKEKEIFYNLEHVTDVKAYMKVIQDDRIHLLQNVMDTYPSEISKSINKLPRGFIHGDFSHNNILTREIPSEGKEKSIVVDGIIDFEDMHYGTYLWDISLLMADYCLNPDLESLYALGHVLAGYMSLRHFNDLELSLLKMCIECRLCQVLICCLHAKITYPDNAYISKIFTAEMKWTRLQQLADISNANLLEKWNKIIQSYSLSKR